jgi:hypothetical protein
MRSSGAEAGLLNGDFTLVLGLPGRGRVQPLGSLSVAPHGANRPIQREGAALVEVGAAVERGRPAALWIGQLPASRGEIRSVGMEGLDGE